jgi:hypothetical protein
LLVKKGEFLLIELLEPFIPFNRLQRILPGKSGEIDADHSDVALGTRATHGGGVTAVLLYPAPNFFVIGRGLSCSHDQFLVRRCL